MRGKMKRPGRAKHSSRRFHRMSFGHSKNMTKRKYGKRSGK